MKMKIGAMLILLVATMSFVSATTITAGESYTFNVSTNEPLVYTVVGNSSDMNGLTVEQDGYNITISVDIMMIPDSFSLIFFNNETEVVHHYHSSDCGDCSGSTTYTIYKDRNVTNTVTKYVDREVDSSGETIGTTDKKGGMPSWLWIVIGVVLIGIIVGAYFLMRESSEAYHGDYDITERGSN